MVLWMLRFFVLDPHDDVVVGEDKKNAVDFVVKYTVNYLVVI